MYHDKKIANRNFKKGDKVLLFNSRLKLYPGKLRSRWVRPFIINELFEFGMTDIRSLDTEKVFRVNGHRLKPFYEGFDANWMYTHELVNGCTQTHEEMGS